MRTNRDRALAAVRTADDLAGESQAKDYPATMALVAIAYALLDTADAIRDLRIPERFRNAADPLQAWANEANSAGHEAG